jgi:hypothetical protein
MKDMASAMGSRDSCTALGADDEDRATTSAASTSESKEVSSHIDANADREQEQAQKHTPREEVEAPPKSKEEEILDLYLKQHQQEKQQDVAFQGYA